MKTLDHLLLSVMLGLQVGIFKKDKKNYSSEVFKDTHMGRFIHIWLAKEKRKDDYQQNEFTPFGWEFMYQDKPPRNNPVATLIDTKARNSGIISNPDIHKRLRHPGFLIYDNLVNSALGRKWNWFYYHDLDKNGDPPDEIRFKVEPFLIHIANENVTFDELGELEKNNQIYEFGQNTLLDTFTLVHQSLNMYKSK